MGNTMICRLGLLAAIVAVAQAAQCGFKDGFQRPDLMKKTAEKCEEVGSFLKIADAREELLNELGLEYPQYDFLGSGDSCEITTIDGNPNCVTSISPSGDAEEDTLSQCQITFRGKKVKVSTSEVTFDEENRKALSLLLIIDGCEAIGNLRRYVGSPDATFNRLHFFFEHQIASFTLCFEESNEELSTCTDPYVLPD